MIKIVADVEQSWVGTAETLEEATRMVESMRGLRIQAPPRIFATFTQDGVVLAEGVEVPGHR